MKANNKPTRKKVILIVLAVVLALILLALIGVAVYVNWFLGKIHKDPDQEVTLSPEQIQQVLEEDQDATRPSDATLVVPEAVQWEQADKVESADHIFNILLIGQDRRPGEIRARSDTMILITINTKDHTLSMTSFLRDLYVQIPGYSPNRLNVPYVLGGFNLLADTMELNFGIRPDRFVEVDFDGFKTVIDAVGGVDIELTGAEASYMNKQGNGPVTVGVNHLNSEQALAYARNRSVGGSGDFARTQRQRNVISALFEKSRSLNLVQINDLILSLTEVITTNLTSAEIMSYVVQFYPMLSQLASPESVRIPADGTYYLGWVDGVGSVVVADFDENRKVIADTQK